MINKTNMAVVDIRNRTVLFRGTPTQCEFFIEERGHRVVADCPQGTTLYVK